MSRLRTAFERYIGMRQVLGYKYDGPAKRLSEFVAFMEARDAETITADLAMEWVTSMGRQPSWSIRLADVRGFAQPAAPTSAAQDKARRDLASDRREGSAAPDRVCDVAAISR